MIRVLARVVGMMVTNTRNFLNSKDTPFSMLMMKNARVEMRRKVRRRRRLPRRPSVKVVSRSPAISKPHLEH